MVFHQHSPHRKTIRLQDYNYAENGLYFITICIQDRLCLLGEIIDNQMYLNNAGKMIDYWYKELASHFPNIQCREYVIMPNHIHFIIQIEYRSELVSLFDVIYWFKTMTTNHYIRQVKTSSWQSFNRKLWQRSYYEHIIRNDKSYREIVQYMENNPYNWQSDSLFNGAGTSTRPYTIQDL